MEVETVRPAFIFALFAVHHTAASDRSRPYVVKCPADKHVIADPLDAGTRVTWNPDVDVVFGDHGSGIREKWIGPRSGQPGDYYTHHQSPYTISYSAINFSGNVLQDGCVFRIFVRVVRCTYLRAPINGYVSCSYGNIYGSNCNTYCFPGFQLVGNPVSRCERNGEWSGTRPVCI